ncbi:MAG: NAD(P)-dependent alcohol dehydrogenase [candidate division WS1 bacterium]|nr:NAD(P)-dependent alcohol dehydrogenase [candidate division WS1 bacterium]
MADTMKAAVLHGIHDMRVEDVALPQPSAERDVLVRVHSVGVCGSDVHFFERGRIGNTKLEQPTVMGHEAAGEVVEVTGEACGLRAGDRVAIEPGYTCRRCEACRSGSYNLCREVIFLGTPPVDGAFSEYVTWPADFLFKLPDSGSYDEGAMIEPLAVGLWAAWRATVRSGDQVAVFGAGPIGLTTLQAAIAEGATRVIVSDTVPQRLELAGKLGATDLLNAAEDDVEQAIREMTGGRGVDVAFECAGAVPALQSALRVARNGGRVQIVGMPGERSPQLPLYEIISREVDLRGLFRYANCYGPAISLVEAGRVDVRSLVTHHFDLSDTPEVMTFVHERRDGVIKAIINP